MSERGSNPYAHVSGRHFKGERRVRLDRERIEGGEPAKNLARNRTPHCRYVMGSKAYNPKRSKKAATKPQKKAA